MSKEMHVQMPKDHAVLMIYDGTPTTSFEINLRRSAMNVLKTVHKSKCKYLQYTQYLAYYPTLAGFKF